MAIKGSLRTKENNPAVPISVGERVDVTRKAVEAEDTICHTHMRKILGLRPYVARSGKPRSKPGGDRKSHGGHANNGWPGGCIEQERRA
ncbi:MAG: 3-keto-5-aminohexanoate cleavage protein [Paracoccaceae bacterium]